MEVPGSNPGEFLTTICALYPTVTPLLKYLNLQFWFLLLLSFKLFTYLVYLEAMTKFDFFMHEYPSIRKLSM